MFKQKKVIETPEAAFQRKKLFRFRTSLCLLSGLMLGFSFPPFPFGVLACFGLVPLLIVLADIDNVKPSFRYIYLAMLVFHVITLNWTGGYVHMKDPYMMIAGALTMLLHPLFYFLPIGLYMFTKKHLGHMAAIIGLPFLWVGYEYSHSLGEWSFPWITIGNSQSYDLFRMQFISYTGVFGLSFWVLVINLLVFLLYSGLAQSSFTAKSWKSIRLVAWIGLIFILPSIHGWWVIKNAPETGNLADGKDKETIRVGMIQSNIDPWAKWQGSAFDAVKYYLQKTDSLVKAHPDDPPELVLWPETAVTYYFLTEQGKDFREYLQGEIDRIQVSVLTGFQHAVFYEDSTKAPPSSKRMKSTGQRYDAFNSAALLQPGRTEVQWYGKMKMVPIAERVPYADVFYYLDFLRWGVGIGGWQIGPDSIIFEDDRSDASFATMICYESTYPGFVASFVRKGAEFVSIITIDSWWGRMSGAFQHHQYAIFRAVENHRWIPRCAVGGMSSYIDPYGRVYDKTELFTEATLIRTIERRNDLTFYTEHGDWLGAGCMMLGGLLSIAALSQRFMNRKRTQT
ncbi:MAG: apolipoprotein N-acyltransferase [Bacteroidota bacterium]